MSGAPARYDVIVLGVGGMGSAACWRLAQRGARVLGLEQHSIAHALGSSHGETRLIRQAYFEHPDYVPLLRRVYELWEELEEKTGERLFHRNGLMIYGPEAPGGIIAGIRASARLHAVPIEEGRAYAAFRPDASATGVFEPGAGYLEVERCVAAQARLAERLGATILTGARVDAWREDGGAVRVETSHGAFEAAALVVTAGPWSKAQLPWLAPRLSVHRVPLWWFEARPGFAARDGAPCFGFEEPHGFFYGLPDLGDGTVKVGLHTPGARVERPEDVDRGMDQAELAVMRRFVEERLPLARANLVKHTVCLYTMTPDETFVVDRVGRISYAAGFSGHGFKFAPVIGEALADLATSGSSPLPIGFLRTRWLDDRS